MDKITHENALRLFSFDMFSHIPKEQLRCGARAQADGRRPGIPFVRTAEEAGTDTVTVLDLAEGLPG